jgi:hypothetical protein
VSNSTLSGNHAAGTLGGGIFNYGTVSVSKSTLSGNFAGMWGGGIYNSEIGTVTVSNSTFSDNRAGTFGGGIFNAWTTGGGIFPSGPVTVINSTFAGNSAMQAGGIFNGGGRTLTLLNTIVANSPTGNNCYGAITDGGGNLSYLDATCPGINADPMLGPLQNNGGPTETMAILPGSAAIDAANDAICAAAPVNGLDQRGIVRPQGAHCDIGAYEAAAPLLRVAIDIKPDTPENVIGANKKGIIQVAILSSETFDSPAEVDRSSLTFGRTGDESSLQVKKDGSAKCEPWDVNGDARLDLVCHFWGKIAGFQTGDTEGTLKGMTVYDVPLEGRDMVRIVP